MKKSESQFEQLGNQYTSKPDGYYNLERTEMLKYIPEHARTILDVGCAKGDFGKNLKAIKPEIRVWGIEPFEAAASEARKKLDYVVTSVFQDDMQELKGIKFDVIVFNDVLEHLVNPDKALNTCRQYLSNNGCIVSSIPNILFFPMVLEIFKTQDWRYRDHGTLDNTHLRFFTKKSIVRLFEDAGYKIQVIEGINSRKCGKIYSVLNTLLLGKLKEWKYLQFAVQVKV